MIVIVSRTMFNDPFDPEWIVEFTIDGLEYRQGVPISDGKSDQDALDYLTPMYSRLMGEAQNELELKGFHFLDRETNTIKVRCKTEQQTEIDDMKKRLETLEDATGITPG